MHAKIGFRQKLQHVSLVDDVADLFAGAVDFRLVNHFASEESL